MAKAKKKIKSKTNKAKSTKVSKMSKGVKVTKMKAAKPKAAKVKVAKVKAAKSKAAKPKAAKVKAAKPMSFSKTMAEAVRLQGQLVPDLVLPSTGGQTVSLRELKGKKVVLYFYPKDMTPGCTIEGHEFTKLKDDFASKNAVVFGVSRDTVDLHEKFKAKECYTIDLLSDTDEKLCNAFQVIKDKNMYGKTVRGIERSTFVIDENGLITHEWRGVKAEGHAAQVLSSI